MKLNILNINNETIHLTYCTNIHKEKNWKKIFKNLNTYPNLIRKKIKKNEKFSIGLCLSHLNTLELKNILITFKQWLKNNHFYIQTINGFCYQTFHKKNIKHSIYYPNWNNIKRYNFTKLLIKTLNYLLTEKYGTISTIPIFYKKTVKTKKVKYYSLQKSIINLMKIIVYLHNFKKKTNLYICLEPEPDCLLENTNDIIFFYTQHLWKHGTEYLHKNFKIKKKNALLLIKYYIQICYDVCHFALLEESPHKTFITLNKKSIKIGKIQASLCININEPRSFYLKKKFLENIKEITKKTQFLHQTELKNLITKKKTKIKDLEDILKKNEDITKKNKYDTKIQQYKIHYHVPLYKKTYQKFKITNLPLLQTIKNIHLTTTKVVEIETYTWSCIKKSQKLNISKSLINEYKIILNITHN